MLRSIYTLAQKKTQHSGVGSATVQGHQIIPLGGIKRTLHTKRIINNFVLLHSFANFTDRRYNTNIIKMTSLKIQSYKGGSFSF